MLANNIQFNIKKRETLIIIYYIIVDLKMWAVSNSYTQNEDKLINLSILLFKFFSTYNTHKLFTWLW